MGLRIVATATGNVVYFMPPYVITPDQVDALVVTARDGIEAATCD